MSFLFKGKAAIVEEKKDPTTLAKEWRRNLAKEARSIERDIEHLGREEKKALSECKKLAKEGRVGAAKILAKEVVGTRKAVERMQSCLDMEEKEKMIDIMQSSSFISSAYQYFIRRCLQQTMIKMQGCMSKSAEIMHSMNSLVKLPEVRETMNAMAKEMMRAGMIEEMVDETMSSMEPEGLQGEADLEVDKIILELTAGILGTNAAPTGKIAGQTAAAQAAAAEEEKARAAQSEAEAAELVAMQERLQGL